MRLKKLSIITTEPIVLGVSPFQEKKPIAHIWARALQTAQTQQNYEALACYNDEVYKQLFVDAEEKKALFEQYQATSHQSGKQLPGLKARATGMIRDFELARKASKQKVE